MLKYTPRLPQLHLHLEFTSKEECWINLLYQVNRHNIPQYQYWNIFKQPEIVCNILPSIQSQNNDDNIL
jgi:hypothetical protein